jgi:hypothetical protein
MVAIVPDMGTEVTIVSSRSLAPLQPGTFASPPPLEILAIFQRQRQLAAFPAWPGEVRRGRCQRCCVPVVVDKLQMLMEPRLRLNVFLTS